MNAKQHDHTGRIIDPNDNKPRSGVMSGIKASFVFTSFTVSRAAGATAALICAMLVCAARAMPPTEGLHIWYDAEDVTASGDSGDNPAHGASVNTWYDKATADGSQNATVAANSTAPTVFTNAANGRASVFFKASDKSAMQFSPVLSSDTLKPRSFFIVAWGASVVSLTMSAAVPGNYGLFHHNGARIFNGYSDGTTTEVKSGDAAAIAPPFRLGSYVMATNGTLVHENGAFIAPFLGTTNHTFVTRSGTHLMGTPTTTVASLFRTNQVAEVIMYTDAVGVARRVLVENYLAAKYGLALDAAVDLYTGDDPANGDYDLDVIGIARAGGETVSAAGAAGLRLASAGAGLAEGAFVFAGHKATGSARVATDLPAGVLQRWSRVWCVQKTGTAGATLTFDYSDAAMGAPSGTPTYSLLFSPVQNPYAFSKLALTPSVSGDAVSFTLADADLANGYYTLGTDEADPVVPPPPAEGAAVLTDNLHIWYDAGDVMASGDPGDNPAHGASVNTWYDKATADGSQNATVAANSTTPTVFTNAVNGRASVFFKASDKSAMQFSPVLSPDTLKPRSFIIVAWGASVVSLDMSGAAPGNYGLFHYNGARIFNGYSDGTTTEVKSGDVAAIAPPFRLGSYVMATNGTLVHENGAFMAPSSGTTNHTFVTRSGTHLMGTPTTTVASLFRTNQVAEVLMYTQAIGTAQRRITENSLGAKYGISLGSADLYRGDDPDKGNYDLDVFGIGRAAAGDEVAASSRRGLGLVGVWLGDGQYLMAGHSSPDNAYMSVEHGSVSPSTMERWKRVWYVDVTGFMRAQLSFNPAEGGIVERRQHYFLLYSAAEPLAWTKLDVAAIDDGTRITFDVPADRLASGYYTLGAYSPKGSVIVVR